MAATRGELKGKILRLLYKNAKFTGVYQPETIDDAITEAMDAVSVEMFLADEGWLKKILTLPAEAGQLSIDLPVSAAMIDEVRYRFGTTYVTMLYDQAWGADQFASDSGVRQWSYSYQIVDNALYFNPPLAEGGADYLQITYQAYPKRLQDDADFLESQFDNSMQHFIKYRAATIMAASAEKPAVPWSGLEQFWYDKMKQVVIMRNKQSQPIREFQGW
jgi:hypothetical protein